MPCRRTFALAFAAASLALAAPADPPGSGRRWDFEADEPGRAPAGFATAKGRWAVVRDGDGRVLAQQAEGDDDAFNLALIDGTERKDLDLSVRIRAVEGKNDQGGGLVWRARDARNYYVARYNPLEDNLRVYKVQGGKRTLFEHAKVGGDNAWHTLRITMRGDRIACFLDGKAYLDVRDSTFPDAGRIGVWSKADARTYFDDLALADDPTVK